VREKMTKSEEKMTKRDKLECNEWDWILQCWLFENRLVRYQDKWGYL